MKPICNYCKFNINGICKNSNFNPGLDLGEYCPVVTLKPEFGTRAYFFKDYSFLIITEDDFTGLKTTKKYSEKEINKLVPGLYDAVLENITCS